MGFYNFETFNREYSVSQGFNNDRFPLYIHELHPVTFEPCQNSNNTLVQNVGAIYGLNICTKVFINAVLARIQNMKRITCLGGQTELKWGLFYTAAKVCCTSLKTLQLSN